MSAPLSNRISVTRTRCSGSIGLMPARKKQMKMGVGKESAPSVIHLSKRKRFFTSDKFTHYLIDGKTQNRRVLRHRVRVLSLAKCNRMNPRRHLLCTLAFLLGLPLGARAAESTSDSAAFLAQHQGELELFFNQHGGAMLKDSLPILISATGNLLLATALVGWLIDIPLSWGFSTIFAPAYGKFTRALIYASGRLMLALLFSVVLTFCALLGINAGAALAAFFVVTVLSVPAVVLQVCWVSYQYRTGPKPSLLFYCVLLLAHGLALLILIPTLFSAQVSGAFARVIDQSVVPALQADTVQVQRDASVDSAERDSAQAASTALSQRLARDQADEQDLENRIAANKDSPAVIFSRLVLQRAQGDLAGAGTNLADFIRRYPNDPHAGAARGELTAINQALAAQLRLVQQQQAANAVAEAQARAQLLARLAAGHATLSEVRRALIGKTTGDVAALFGAPTEQAADRWGYGRRMVFDPETSESLGLTVVFSEGLVQGVDYYYGVGP
jgi:hypothetical protein